MIILASKWVMPLLIWRRIIAALMLVPPLPPRLFHLRLKCALVLHRPLALSQPPHRLLPGFVGLLSILI